MPVYVVHGKLGSGKGKYIVGVMRQALRDGRRVATNMDIRLEHLVGPMNRGTIIRLPDKPTAQDLEMIGHGNADSYDEDRNGVLALDEAGTWLNSRSFMDKSRQEFIDWMLHARKLGWDPYLQVQDIGMIDKQFRTGLADVLVRCIAAHKMRYPVIGQFLPKKLGRMPRFHIANFSLAEVPGVITDRDWYRNDDLQEAYDTRQVFKADYPHGVHSLLSAWHLVGRHQVEVKRTHFLARVFRAGRPLPPARKPKLPLVQLLERLPPDRRIYWGARLARAGAL